MLRIRTTIGPSRVGGFGLFAAEPVPEGAVTWVYDPGLDPDYARSEIEALSPVAQEFFWSYQYFHAGIGRHVMCLDNERYINHDAETANLRGSAERNVARRDIAAGEELFVNYNDFDPTYWRTLPEEKAAFRDLLMADLDRRGLL
jgi:SET domain-containing protein